MITLYNFGPAFGLPDPSPFCTKTEMLLKISGLDYTTDQSGFRKAPKGKQPYINDACTMVADSTFIRKHIENKYGFDFNAGLDARDTGIALSVEKMCEDHLYWVLINERWCNDENFNRGPRIFFKDAPAPIRPLITAMVRKKVVKSTLAHGLGRHTTPEIHQQADDAIQAIANILGSNKYLMGGKVCGADATVTAFLLALACKHFETPVIAMVEKHSNLSKYIERMTTEWFPDL